MKNDRGHERGKNERSAGHQGFCQGVCVFEDKNDHDSTQRFSTVNNHANSNDRMNKNA